MHVLLIAIAVHINGYITSFTTWPCNSKTICVTDLILLQKMVLGVRNTMVQKSEFSKMRVCKLDHI